jgi:hypothetical protein
VRDDVHRVGEPHDGIADKLAWTVPGDLAAAIRIDDGGTVGGSLGVLSALARCVHRRVLEKNDSVWRQPCDDGSVECALLFEGF